MKSTIVPAQMTTVEDKIIGSLSITQMALLIAPVIILAVMFAMLPPFVKVTPYKLSVGGVFILIGTILAVRLKGELVLNRMLTRAAYNSRPKYYVFDKNDSYVRHEPTEQGIVAEFSAALPETTERSVHSLVDIPVRARLEQAIADPRANFNFSVRKGGLHVSIHEIKD